MGQGTKNILRKKYFRTFSEDMTQNFCVPLRTKNNVFVFFDRCRAETKVGYPVYQ